ncbi:MAG TPA: hypothetical protein VFA18_22065 [Gemmataceae bacterium]|nr:hypothetical protein [Gemmataceae bacterium]
MSEQFGPLEVECDAPSYAVVRACSELGIQTPEDVRWCRLSHWLNGPHGLQRLLQAKGRSAERQCLCGSSLPHMQGYLFTFNTGKEVFYLLGQCSRCHTVFWDWAAVPASS